MTDPNKTIYLIILSKHNTFVPIVTPMLNFILPYDLKRKKEYFVIYPPKHNTDI